MSRFILQRLAVASLLLWCIEVQAERYTVPLMVPAGTSSEPQGVVRILNASDESGEVEIYAIGDDGTRSGPATFTLNASSAAEFTAMDLASGNATLGLTGGIGTEVGDARLQIETDLDIVPLAFVRAVDGTLSAMHDTVRGASAAESGQHTYGVPIFNPSTEMTQVSRLRLINPGDAAAAVTIGGRDDSGAEAIMGDVTLALAAGGAKTLTAQQLEAGDTDLTGQLGAGTGKWRLTVSSDQPLEVVNIVASTAGYRNNLSTTAVAGAAPADEAGLSERFVGNSIIYETSGARSTLEAAAGNRFTDTMEAGGVTATHMGSYSYRAIGPDAGLLTLDYDGGDQCRANLYFSSRTSGWFASHCTGSDYPAEGSWLGGTWVVEADDDDGDGDVTETTYEVNDSLPGVPTSGFFIPAVTSGGSVTASASGTTVALNDGGYIELNDGTRYTCASADGCTITNGTVTAGTVTGRAPGAGEVDRFPSFRTAAAPGNQTYTLGTAIDTLTLPEATGGNGALTYSLAPSVPGLTFNATTRQLTGTPTTAGTHAMTYTVMDEDGDTDTLNFSIDVEESDDGASAADSYVLDVDGGNGSAVGIVYANERLYVVDSVSDKVFAYSESGQREATSDFDLDDDNVLPDGIAYVNERFYVVDWYRQKVYGYTASGQRDATADFDLDDDNGSADGIAFANGRFYVVDRSDNKVYAYSASGQRDAAADFDLQAENRFAVGMVYANERFHVVDSFRDKVYAYTESGQYDAAGDFALHEDNDRPDGIGYGNDRFYAVDTASDRVYAYAGAPEPEDTSPGFAAGAGPGNQMYTVGTAIDTLTLPEATGGNGDLTYSLTPEVPGLSFDAAARQLTGTPSTAGAYTMTYTAADEDSDTDTLNFGITVIEGETQTAPLALGGCTDGRYVDDPGGNPGLVGDCHALVGIANALADDHVLRQWGSGEKVRIDRWSGIGVSGGRVTELLFERSRLTGPISSEVGRLTALQNLDLSQNQFTGEIPPELGNLSELQTLYLSENQLSGAIPPEIGNLSKLRHLDLSFNQLMTGDIPAELGNLTALQELNLYDNQFTGAIPPELGSLTELTQLALSRNQFTGEIPPELGNLSELQTLDLSENQLSGAIPPEIGNLSKLLFLDLDFNRLTGAIPAELGNLTELLGLRLNNNQLTGAIPPEIGGLTALQRLVLAVNRLTGAVPAELGALANLLFLDISSNEIADISLLALNAQWGDGVRMDVSGNPLNDESFDTHIPALKARGVSVNHTFRVADEFPDSRLIHVFNDNVIVMQAEADLAPGTLRDSLAAYATDFYQWFEDEFDYLLFVSNLATSHWLQSRFTYAGRYYSVMNDTKGIGMSQFLDSRFSSAGRLRGVIHFPYSRALQNGPSLHELHHAWANYTVPTAERFHWGFSSANGQLGGFDIANLVDLGNGRWTAGKFGSIANGQRVPYSPIELYFAGLIPREEVPDLWVAEDGEWLDDGNGARVRTGDGDFVFTAENVRTITIADIVAEHGERDPPMAERPHQRAAVILLIDDTHLPSAAELQTVSEHAAWLSFRGSDENSLHNYYEATGGRGTLTLDGLSEVRKSEAADPADLPASFGVPPPPRMTTVEELCGSYVQTVRPDGYPSAHETHATGVDSLCNASPSGSYEIVR